MIIMKKPEGLKLNIGMRSYEFIRITQLRTAKTNKEFMDTRFKL